MVMVRKQPTYRHSGYNTCLGGSSMGINDLMFELVQPSKVFGSNMGVFLQMHGQLGKKKPCRPMGPGGRH